MAIHHFICDGCNVTVTDTSAKDVHLCPSCNGEMRWDLGGLQVNDMNREQWSISMGVPAGQVEEARKHYPGSVYNSRGDLLIKNAKHRDQEAKRRGMVKLDNPKK